LAVHFVAFLQRLVQAYPTGQVYLALDNAPTHTAKVVQRPLAAHPHVHALWLPKYAAHEVNPVERIWGLMKGAVAADRLAGSIEELAAAARRFFAEMAPHPVKLPSVA
jgi:transposase